MKGSNLTSTSYNRLKYDTADLSDIAKIRSLTFTEKHREPDLTGLKKRRNRKSLYNFRVNFPVDKDVYVLFKEKCHLNGTTVAQTLRDFIEDYE